MARADGRREVGRLAADRSAVASIEMALVGGLMMMLTLIMTATTVAYFAQISLDRATQNAARLLQTGQIAPGSVQQFITDSFCNSLAGLLDCSRIAVGLAPVANFTNPAGVSTGTFNPGVTANLMLLNAQYMMGWGSFLLPIDHLSSSAAFRNEN